MDSQDLDHCLISDSDSAHRFPQTVPSASFWELPRITIICYVSYGRLLGMNKDNPKINFHEVSRNPSVSHPGRMVSLAKEVKKHFSLKSSWWIQINWDCAWPKLNGGVGAMQWHENRAWLFRVAEPLNASHSFCFILPLKKSKPPKGKKECGEPHGCLTKTSKYVNKHGGKNSYLDIWCFLPDHFFLTLDMKSGRKCQRAVGGIDRTQRFFHFNFRIHNYIIP